jgi:kumamolisin
MRSKLVKHRQHYHTEPRHIAPSTCHRMASFSPGTLSPPQVCAGYQFVKTGPLPSTKIGIISLGGGIDENDVKAAFQAWGLPAPKIAYVSVDGATNSPSSDQDANVENQLDVQVSAAAWAYCTGTPAAIVFLSAPNNGTGIAHAITAGVASGCDVLSLSWGAPESQWQASDRAVTEQALAAAYQVSVPTFVASGDNSLDDGTSTPTVDYPCGSIYSWAVGGTRLIINADGTIEESAWGDGRANDPGGGGGFDSNTPMPSWQRGALPSGSQYRGVPDSSANADPASGYQIVANGSWMEVGGTSGAAPLTAGYLAVCKAMASKAGVAFPALAPTLYGNPSAFNDITTGSDGAPATVGWDEATGLGSPNGPNLLKVLSAAASQPPTPPPTPTPTPLPTPTPAPVGPSAQELIAQIDAAFAALQQTRGFVRFAGVLKYANKMVDAIVLAAYGKASAQRRCAA